MLHAEKLYFTGFYECKNGVLSSTLSQEAPALLY